MRQHRRPLIGKEAEITASPNKELIGVKGTIEDETKNTITIDGKRFPKETITITIDDHDINGKTINKTPTERIKVHKQ